ncbi:uncharacterized protein V6R79_021835 [Siganus canaliculatus]
MDTFAFEPRRGNASSRNQDFSRHRRPLARPRNAGGVSTWLPGGSRSARHAHRRPVYVSFVTKAILWDRGLCHHTVPDGPCSRPSACPRFLSHMKTRPEDLSSKSTPPPLFQGKPLATMRTQTLAAPGSDPESSQQNPWCLQAGAAPAGGGVVRPRADRKRHEALSERLKAGRSSASAAPAAAAAAAAAAVVVPSLPVPAAPPSSTFHPEPPNQNLSPPESGGRQTSVLASRSDPLPAPERKDVTQNEEPRLSERPDPRPEVHLSPAGPERSPSLTSVVSQGSDFSRPLSSRFSRSTDFSSGRSSFLSDFPDSDPEVRPVFSPRSVVESPLGSCPSGGPSRTPPGRSERSPRPAPSLLPQLHKPSHRLESDATSETLCPDASVDTGLNPSSESDQGLLNLAFPSATWSSCPSPQRTTSRSGSGPKLTPSASSARLESQRWSVLPPISPSRERCDTAASRSVSELSCSHSHVFDELDAIAPRSTSCPSVDEASDSSGRPSPDTELSPGLAALTVGCHSGNLGSLSRVQLLLLDRLEPETLPSPFHQGEELSPVPEWSDPRFTAAGSV